MKTTQSFRIAQIISLYSFLCVGVFTSLASAVEFAGGVGEPNDPYRIATAEQLIGISSDPNLFDRHFVLTADIDLDPSLPGRQVFRQAVVEFYRPGTRSVRYSVISADASAGSASFAGSFDGGGHVIRNCLLVKSRDTRYVGFFGEIAPQGVVRNLHIEDMMIADLGDAAPIGRYCGLLAAVNRGTVLGCSAAGTLTTYTGGGGLVGQNAGLVVGCRASCDLFGNAIGGLIGANDASGRVVLCESNGIIYASMGAGGLVNTNAGTIQYCTVDGLVLAAHAGGLVCDNKGTIRECCVTATVESGGGVAYSNSGTIVNCYTTGSASDIFFDGLVATNQGTILSSYSTRTSLPKPAGITIRRSVGSDAAADSGASAVSILAERLVRYVYYLDPAKAGEQTGSSHDLNYGIALSPDQMMQASSFVGFDFHGDANDGFADHWFMPPDGYPVLTWQTEITGLAGIPDVSGLSPEQARMVLEFAGLKADDIRYDYARPKVVSSGWPPQQIDTKGQVIATHPVGYLPPGGAVEILVSLGQYDFGVNPGDGSKEKPYQIETPGQLDALYGQSSLSGKHFQLTADIDLSRYTYPTSLIASFSGEFNGNGHTIRNLKTVHGLFGAIEPGALVHDLTVENAWIENWTVEWSFVQLPSPEIGILAGVNRGQVLRCIASGQVLGGWTGIGGLVGRNAGELADCAFSGRVRPGNGASYVGGLVGMNSGSIVRCCARNIDVLGGNNVGGLIGESSPPSILIEACYATGAVQGVSAVGGLIGHHGVAYRPSRRSVPAQDEISVDADPVAGTVIQNCYTACSVTGQQGVGGCIGLVSGPETAPKSCFFLALEDGGGPDNGLGTLLTDSQMKQQASFIGWDFAETWTICEGRDYPRLRWEQAECSE